MGFIPSKNVLGWIFSRHALIWRNRLKREGFSFVGIDVVKITVYLPAVLGFGFGVKGFAADPISWKGSNVITRFWE